jgi:hypothetical protein
MQHFPEGPFLIKISPNGSLVAVTQGLSRRVVILDTGSGNAWLVIETFMEWG